VADGVGSMTIDERLERLTERHEALTQTVELMAAENRAGFERLERVEKGFQRVEQILGKMAQSMDTLARVVELHEHRIDDLESRSS
jgi:methyl-accepting chemotaxis protein